MENKSLLDKIKFILQIAKKGFYTDKELSVLLRYLKIHTDNLVLGRFFGYSVSDHAFACLKWINNEESNKIFDDNFNKLSVDRQKEINELIRTNRYLEI